MRVFASSLLLLLGSSVLIQAQAPAPSADPLGQKIDGYFRGSSFPKAGRSLHDKVREAEQFLKREMPSMPTVGAAVSVVYQDQVVLAKGYGLMDSSDKASAVSASTTMFQIGSVSKAMIAVAVGLLVEDKAVDWKDPVIQHLPWLELFDKYAQKHVTIGNLLSMNSGFGRSPDITLFTGWLDEKAAVKALGAMEPDSPLRQTPAYGNINFQILGQMIEHVSGKPWYQFLQDRVWTPLGMHHTFASAKSVPKELLDKSLSKGHFVCGGQVLGPYDLVSSVTADMTPGLAMDYIAAGSIVSSAEDMAIFTRMLLGKGRVGNTTLFRSPATVATMITGKNVAAFGVSPMSGLRFEPDGSTLAAGYGFDYVGNLVWNRPYVNKGGDTAVHHALLSFLPQDAIGVTLLVNSQGSFQIVNQLSAYVKGIFLDIPKPILDHQLKQWRAAVPPMEPPVPGAPACGFQFWENPPKSLLTPEEESSLIGVYAATSSAGFLPPASFARTETQGEYAFQLGKANSTVFCLDLGDGSKITIPRGEATIVGGGAMITFADGVASVVLGTAEYRRVSA